MARLLDVIRAAEAACVMAPKRKVKQCERCGERAAVAGERYCKKCRWWVLSGMYREGYLTPNPAGYSTGAILDDMEFDSEAGRVTGNRGRKYLGDS